MVKKSTYVEGGFVMEAKQLIKAHPVVQRFANTGECLHVSEFFFDSIQGEGIHLGHPAAFLRLQECTLNCFWCDTNEVWRKGNPYTFTELYEMIAARGADDKLRNRQHLVITGGSPLLQQERLVKFIQGFISYFGFKPYIEIENECVLIPDHRLIPLVDCWNNSPKLENSGNARFERYDKEVILTTAHLENSWFKFVINTPCDWNEIEEEFLQPSLIQKHQIILMPEGATREELALHTDRTLEIAIREGVLYRSREHVVLWDKTVGI